MDRYVGRHRKPVDHVLSCTPCCKLRLAMGLFLVVLGASATYAFGGIAEAAPDPPQTVPVADVVATPAVNTACFR